MTDADGGPVTIGIDVGGTNLRAGTVDAAGRVCARIETDTPRAAEDLERLLVDTVAALSAEQPGDRPVAAVGLAVAGFVSRERDRVRFAPHLPWRDAAVADRLTPRMGMPVFLEHDANSAAWAELVFGPAGEGENVAVIALGTGVGAALLIDGRMYRGSNGVAPELGHLPVVPGGRVCPCGKRGCLERYCSGTALAATAREMLTDRPDLLPSVLGEIPAEKIGGVDVARAAADGDRLARAVMADMAHWLGVGLSIVADVFDPDLIVVAGGVSASAALFLDDARRVYAGRVTGAGHRRLARIRRSELGLDAALIGAAEVARRGLRESAEQQGPGAETADVDRTDARNQDRGR